MFTIVLNDNRDDDHWDEELQEFIVSEPKTHTFRHCLYSVALWETKYKLPFLNHLPEITPVQLFDYFKMMCLEDDLDISLLDESATTKLLEYMRDPKTATTINENPFKHGGNKVKSQKVTTSDEIYAHMFIGQIPIECEHWELDRLLITMRVMGELQKSQDPNNKMAKKDIATQNRELNRQRREAMKSRG